MLSHSIFTNLTSIKIQNYTFLSKHYYKIKQVKKQQQKENKDENFKTELKFCLRFILT